MDKLEAHRDKSVIVCCNSGSQSMQVCATLSKAGFDSVYNLHGGILAWQNAGLPTTKR
jgi:rhodanese-related sulfurtransferase